MTDTATPGLWDALADLIEAGADVPLDDNGDPILSPAWPRYYRGKVKPDAAGNLPPPGYFMFGIAIPVPVVFYGGEEGEDGLYLIECWASTPDDANELARWLKRLVHLRLLSVEGYEPVVGTIRTSGPTADPGRTAWKVSAFYEAEPMEAAA